MRDDFTDITVVLDRSGSMAAVADDTIGGFNQFLLDQKRAPGDGVLTLVQFDNEYEFVHTAKPLGEVPPLSPATFIPRGSTALLDAINRAIGETHERIAKMDEAQRPGTVIVVILTDGHENSSQEWTHEAVGKAIARQERDYAWDFVFLGANMDAVAVGQQMGFAADKSMTYAADSDAVGSAWAATSGYVARRNAAPIGAEVPGFSDEERAAAGGRR